MTTTTTVRRPNPVSTRQVDWVPVQNRFIGFMSDVNGFGRVWDDAADLGLTLVSHKTGKEMVFVISSEKRDSDGEVQFYTLASLDENYTMTLFND